MRFVDTNIALYAVSPLPEELDKRSIALELIDGGDLALSAQVLQEFYTQATRHRGPWQMTHDEAVEFITTHLLPFPVQSVTLELVQNALDIRARFGLNYWDCAILAAARLLGCDAVYSEDMSDRQDYDGLRVVNPFAHLTQLA